MELEFVRAIASRKVSVAVLGQGYVGLPLSLAICQAGFTVFGYDPDVSRIEQLKKGKSYVTDVSSELLQETLAKNFFPVSQKKDLKKCQVFLICVPTPLTKQRDPDLSSLKEACDTVLSCLSLPALISLESTSYPGTTEEYLVAPLQGKKRIGQDLFVVYSPERVDPNNPHYHVRNTPKLISGATPSCLKVGKAFYGTFIEKLVPVKSLKVAEMAKIYENVFRSVNIALVNELALLCDKMKISVWEVIQAASSKPYGFMPFYPGPGLGGHCIPVDPFYLAWKAREYQFLTRFVELAGEVNWYMPFFVVHRVRRALDRFQISLRGAKILVLGVSYKPDIGDIRESPALKVMELLLENGSRVSYHDPFVPSFQLGRRKFRSQPLSKKALTTADLVLLITPHSQFDYDFITSQARFVFDTRGKLFGRKRKNVEVL